MTSYGSLAVLGSTGSIGTQALEVAGSEGIPVGLLTGGTNVSLIEQQARRLRVPRVAMADPASARDLATRLADTPTRVYSGREGILDAIRESECATVLNAISGEAGLLPTLTALACSDRLALANKESMVVAGEIVRREADAHGCELIPVDSEHSAIWQCLDFDREKPFEKLILTASGGAFRDLPLENLDSVTAEDALKHPNWDMGKKITIDCATMVNKAFEVIEAKWLFNTTYDKIDVLVHPQSIVHSMVSFRDGSVIAQLARADMKLPIALALTYPERFEVSSDKLSLVGKSLDFLSLDDNRYPCFSIVMEAARRGGVYPCAVSCANEVAVEYFLQGKIKFSKIQDVLRYVLDNITPMDVTYENLVGVDKLAKSLAISRLSHN